MKTKNKIFDGGIRNWEELLLTYKQHLFDDYLPFLNKYVCDYDHGGFKWNTTPAGINIADHKRTWYDGRGIWVYSYLYNNFKEDPEYLKIADKTVELVSRIKKDSADFWPWSYDRLGNDLQEHSPDIYGNLFVAEGLAEYSISVNDRSYWEQAKLILLNCLEIYDRVDYAYKLEYTPDPAVSSAKRVLGHWMIILRVCTGLLKTKSDPTLEDIAKRCVDALIIHHYNPKYKLMNEVLNHDHSFPTNSLSQFVYIGHAIESLWMVMDEAVRRNDDELYKLAADRFKFHVEVAWDDVYGGVFHSLNHVDSNDWLTDKVLWAQEEVLVGVLLMIDQSVKKSQTDPWAQQWFDKVYNYVIDTFPLKAHGSPLWKIGGDRVLSYNGNERVENYHHPRHLMLNIRMIEHIIQQKKKE